MKSFLYVFIILILSFPISLMSMKRSGDEIDSTQVTKKKKKMRVSPLVDAAKKGDLEEIKRLLEEGYYIDTYSASGLTPLMWAAKKGHKAAVECLLASKAKVNERSNGFTPLLCAAQQSNGEIVQILLKNGANIDAKNNEGQTALMIAAAQGHKEIVKTFLAHGIHPNEQDDEGTTALMFAAEQGHTEVLQLLLQAEVEKDVQNKHGVTALMMAAKTGQGQALRMLINHKATIDKRDSYNRTALISAAQNGRCEIVKILLDAGAFINAQDKSGATALIVAASRGYKEIVALLLSRGADRTITFQALNGVRGLTALMIAARNGHDEIVKLLIDQTSLNVQAKDGATALMRAAIQGHGKVIETLIEAGAQVDARDKKGATALMRSIANHKVVSLLLKHLARTDLCDNAGKNALHYAHTSSAYESFKLLMLCQLPHIACCRSDSLKYAQHQKANCLDKRRYIRTCNVNYTNCFLLGRSVESVDHMDCYHQHPLMWMAMFGYTEAIKELLKADIPLWYLNAQDKDGCTAIMYAIQYGHYDIVDILIARYKKDQPADKKMAISIRDTAGNSALTYAIKYNCKLELINALLDASSRPTVKDMQIAVQHNRYDIILQFFIRGFIQPKVSELAVT